MEDGRTISDEDIEAIADALQKRMATIFYLDVGKGVLSIVKKVVVLFLIALAAYGAHKGINPS